VSIVLVAPAVWHCPVNVFSDMSLLLITLFSGHTFSKLLEMVPGADIMHGEAVNVDGFFCAVISYLRGYIDMDTVNRIFACMKSLSLPTNSSDLKLDLAWQSCKDAIEHRHGEQRIPLITEIGESICVSDITEEELERALALMEKFDH
jgi:3-dehydroquinate synthetase